MSSCTVVYALEAMPDSDTTSIFLAGPSPRTTDVPSWRPEAIRLLQEAGFMGTIFVPEHRSGEWHGDKLAQMRWEDDCMHAADCILFWVPRNMENMPALTTNVEFGRWEGSGKIVLGSPETAVKNDYLLYHAYMNGVPVGEDLPRTVELSLLVANNIEPFKNNGLREVPLPILQTASFQRWLENQEKAGNKIHHVRPVWTFRVGPGRQFILFWALHVNMFVAAENRYKTNEVVIARPDVSTVVLYQRSEKIDDSVVVLVREYRSTVSNSAGFVYEAPGGSSLQPTGDAMHQAVTEVYEEISLTIDSSRIVRHGSRQLVAPMSTHHAHLFSAALTDEEVAHLRAQASKSFGITEDGERTYVEVMTLGEIRKADVVDWSMLGMILQVLVP